MASVTVCPHCYLQLAVADGVASDARVECPTCQKEFDLTQTVLRAIPEVVPVERVAAPSAPTVADIELKSPEVSSPVESEICLASPSVEFEPESDAPETDDEPDSDLFGNETVPELPLAAEAAVATELESQPTAIAQPQPEAIDDAYQPAVSPRSATLAELMQAGRPQADAKEESGPTFELPNVQLVRDNGGTVEFDSIAGLGATSNTEFELDDVDFDSVTPQSDAADIDEPFADEPHAEVPDFAPTVAADAPSFESRDVVPKPAVFLGSPPRRRRRGPLRTLVGVALGGILGSSVAYYFLMYWAGPSGDFLELAKYFPPQLLPASFAAHSGETMIADSRAMPPVEDMPTHSPVAPVETNIPASFVEPTEEPLADEEPEEEFNRYEPSEFDEAPAEPLATELLPPEPLMTESLSEGPLPLPFEGPSYTASDLESAFATAQRAQAGLVDGDLSDMAVRRTKGMSYAKLCDLAQTYAFFDASSDAPGDHDLQARAERLFSDTLIGARTRDDVARIAAIWIDSPHRRHGGVFLAGAISDGQIAGDIYEYRLDAADGSTYAVLSAQPIDATGRLAAVIGTIVDFPADKGAGYDGTAERAIWVARAIPLE